VRTEPHQMHDAERELAMGSVSESLWF